MNSVDFSGEWPQEPSGFQGLRFGATKEELEQYVVFDWYGAGGDGFGPDMDSPYPTLGVTHVSFANVDITALLTFGAANGLHCIQGMFPADQFEAIRSEFLELFGRPHEESSGVPTFPEEVLKSVPPEHLHHYTANVESLLWYSDSIYIYLVNREHGQSRGQFFLATYSYMRARSGVEKMREKAKRKLACTEDTYTPPDGWRQEPDSFNGLKFDMTITEAAEHVVLGNHIPTFEDRMERYETSLNVGGLDLAGGVLFMDGRLVNVCGHFEKASWDLVKSKFIDVFGKAHRERREEILDQGLYRRLDWQSDRIDIGLLDFPDGTNRGQFHFQRSLKAMAAIAGTSELKIELKIVSFKPIPAPEPPRIRAERTHSSLNLHLPDGRVLDYPRGDSSIARSSWRRIGAGRFIYDLDIDTRVLSAVRIGERGFYCGRQDDTFSQPKGWAWSGLYWTAEGEDAANQIQREPPLFSITSPMQPGSDCDGFASRAEIQRPGDRRYGAVARAVVLRVRRTGGAGADLLQQVRRPSDYTHRGTHGYCASRSPHHILQQHR